MQAWTRTAISLITFGFTVYKLVDVLDRNPADRKYLVGTHVFGFILVAIGFVALAMATIEYRRNIKVLREEYGESPRSTSVIFAGLIAVLGIFALIAMLVFP
jgi:putative membrane protein